MISKEQKTELSKRIKSGDAEAEKFAINYPNMPEEDANKYLSSLTVAEKTDGKTANDEVSGSIMANIKDEYEAIDGYDKAIKNATADGNAAAVSVFEDIKKDEIRHVSLLKDLFKNVSGKELEDGRGI